MKYDYKYLDKVPTQPFDFTRYLVIHSIPYQGERSTSQLDT
jgi:hypothetical protein